MAYIYKIENQINHKVYIGKTEYTNPNRRWTQHKADSKNPQRNHRALYKAMNKYGIENFAFIVLEETQFPEEREIYYIQKYNSYHFGYNETLGGDGKKVLNLPEQEICKFYMQHSLTETATYFCHDTETIKSVLHKYNISIIPAQERNRLTLSKAVAKIDKNTDEILEVYPSVLEAERQNKCHSHIKDVCHGKRKTAGGFKWSFIKNL